jgi:hypothetical protein
VLSAQGKIKSLKFIFHDESTVSPPMSSQTRPDINHKSNCRRCIYSPCGCGTPYAGSHNPTNSARLEINHSARQRRTLQVCVGVHTSENSCCSLRQLQLIRVSSIIAQTALQRRLTADTPSRPARNNSMRQDEQSESPSLHSERIGLRIKIILQLRLPSMHPTK